MATLLFLVLALACAARTSHGAQLLLTTNNTLGGERVRGTPMTMKLTTDENYLTVTFSAPYIKPTGGSWDSDWDRVHLFLADDSHKLSELRFTETGPLLRLYWAPYNMIKTLSPGEDAKFEGSTTVDRMRLTGTAKVHRSLLPPRITLVNAASVHPVNASTTELQYDNLYSITNYGIALPDLMVLARYKAIGARFLFDNDDSYSEHWKRND
ncbi:uncharacterized protein LOC113214586 [Frankliniella occidentalis]|uniref:Uncharacterized protein LOC113214586 n=1 Tax=Frankliniella occidentalis TaxID=133901 RepID=A0A9C6X7U4_FRAOC|nr:uncharacterized protein LOC113214586 [Frankliniella occidentalis]